MYPHDDERGGNSRSRKGPQTPPGTQEREVWAKRRDVPSVAGSPSPGGFSTVRAGRRKPLPEWSLTAAGARTKPQPSTSPHPPWGSRPGTKKGRRQEPTVARFSPGCVRLESRRRASCPCRVGPCMPGWPVRACPVPACPVPACPVPGWPGRVVLGRGPSARQEATGAGAAPARGLRGTEAHRFDGLPAREREDRAACTASPERPSFEPPPGLAFPPPGSREVQGGRMTIQTPSFAPRTPSGSKNHRFEGRPWSRLLALPTPKKTRTSRCPRPQGSYRSRPRRSQSDFLLKECGPGEREGPGERLSQVGVPAPPNSLLEPKKRVLGLELPCSAQTRRKRGTVR